MRKFRYHSISPALIFLAAAIVACLPAFERHYESVNCGNQMHVILDASTHIWAEEHGGRLPADFLSMSNELVSPKFLICPADHSRRPARDWTTFTTNDSTYEILSPGIIQTNSTAIFLRCKIHGYAGFADDRLIDPSGRLIRPERIW